MLRSTLLLAVAGLLAVLAFVEISSPLSAQTNSYGKNVLTLNDFSITDADTIRLNGAHEGTRLVGYNTPEKNPKCDHGRNLRDKAEARFAQLLRSAGRIELEMVQCSCRPGTEGTDDCNFGRSCGILRLDGQDVGTTMIAEGLAAPFNCGKTSCPKTPRPWCE